MSIKELEEAIERNKKLKAGIAEPTEEADKYRKAAQLGIEALEREKIRRKDGRSFVLLPSELYVDR